MTYPGRPESRDTADAVDHGRNIVSCEVVEGMMPVRLLRDIRLPAVSPEVDHPYIVTGTRKVRRLVAASTWDIQFVPVYGKGWSQDHRQRPSVNVPFAPQ